MSDARPIGLFDSGIGGLTVLKELAAALPREHFIYFGDTARMPYGNKSVAAVTYYAEQITRFLLKQQVKAIVVACNTVSAVALDAIRALAGDIPVFQVITPLVDSVLKRLAGQKNATVGVLATRRTVNSRQYPEAIRQRAGDTIKVDQIACPLFVNLVEEGIWSGDLAEAAVGHYLHVWKDEQPDAVLLGCTHFPLLKPLIHDFLPQALILESGPALSEEVAAALAATGQLNTSGEGSRLYYCTDSLESFVEPAVSFLGEPVSQIRQIQWKDEDAKP